MHRPRPKNTRKTKIKYNYQLSQEQKECIDIILTKNILNKFLIPFSYSDNIQRISINENFVESIIVIFYNDYV